MRPTFTVLIGSCGRDTLEESLSSMKHQMIPGDEVIVSFDTRAREPEWYETQLNRVRKFKAGFIATGYTGIADTPKVFPDGSKAAVGQPYSWLGVEQINHALRIIPIATSHVFTIGDDDIFVDGAFANIREVCAKYPNRPILYRFIAPNRWLLWDKPRLRPCWISGCCIAAPVQYVGPHPTDIETTHDYRWIEDILHNAKRDGWDPVWMDFVGVVARPDKAVGRQALWTCYDCNTYGRYENMVGGLVKCTNCRAPIDKNFRIVEPALQE